MEDIPISFSWIYPKLKDKENFSAYCFAFIRDSKTYNVLYAGVKYSGRFSELKKNKPFLRKTAIERLKKKPIFANFCIGDDENYKKNLKDPKFKFNGLDENGNVKKNNSLGKFFVHCAINQTYSDLGIFCNKSSSDLKLNYENQKYEVTNNFSKNAIYIKYGYECKGDEIKRITVKPSIIESIINLRKRARFYGKSKERIVFEDYPNISMEYLAQFGISENKTEDTQLRLREYLNDKRIIYYRVKMSNNVQAHISLMEYHDWYSFVNSVYDTSLEIDIPGMLFNTYCMGFTIRYNYRTQFEKKIFRKIAIDRMIDRPNIIDGNFFDNMKVKDLRQWFAERINYFDKNGIGRINYKSNILSLTSNYVSLPRYNEDIRVYKKYENELQLNPIINFITYPVRFILSWLPANWR